MASGKQPEKQIPAEPPASTFDADDVIFTPLDLAKPPPPDQHIFPGLVEDVDLVRWAPRKQIGGRPRTDPVLLDKLYRKLLVLWPMKAKRGKRQLVKDGAQLVGKLLDRHRRRGFRPIALGNKVLSKIACTVHDQLWPKA